MPELPKFAVSVYFRWATIDLMLIQQNKFCWISDRSMVAHLNYTDTHFSSSANTVVLPTHYSVVVVDVGKDSLLHYCRHQQGRLLQIRRPPTAPRSIELWTFRSQDFSFPGTNVWHGNFRSVELSFPRNFRSLEISFPGTFVPVELSFPWNFRSRGTFVPVELSFPWNFRSLELSLPWNFRSSLQ